MNSLLVQWLWPKLIRQELDELKSRFNDHRVRRDWKKTHPSGVSPNISYSLPKTYGGQESLLQPVDRAVVRKLMEDLGGEDLIRFVSVEFDAQAQEVFDTLSLENVWNIFSLMLPLMFGPQ